MNESVSMNESVTFLGNILALECWLRSPHRSRVAVHELPPARIGHSAHRIFLSEFSRQPLSCSLPNRVPYRSERKKGTGSVLVIV